MCARSIDQFGTQRRVLVAALDLEFERKVAPSHFWMGGARNPDRPTGHLRLLPISYLRRSIRPSGNILVVIFIVLVEPINVSSHQSVGLCNWCLERRPKCLGEEPALHVAPLRLVEGRGARERLALALAQWQTGKDDEGTKFLKNEKIRPRSSHRAYITATGLRRIAVLRRGAIAPRGPALGLLAKGAAAAAAAAAAPLASKRVASRELRAESARQSARGRAL